MRQSSIKDSNEVCKLVFLEWTDFRSIFKVDVEIVYFNYEMFRIFVVTDSKWHYLLWFIPGVHSLNAGSIKQRWTTLVEWQQKIMFLT